MAFVFRPPGAAAPVVASHVSRAPSVPVNTPEISSGFMVIQRMAKAREIGVQQLSDLACVSPAALYSARGDFSLRTMRKLIPALERVRPLDAAEKDALLAEVLHVGRAH